VAVFVVGQSVHFELFSLSTVVVVVVVVVVLFGLTRFVSSFALSCSHKEMS
jgi:hypothetical protein